MRAGVIEPPKRLSNKRSIEVTAEFTIRVASKPEEVKRILEVGFEHVCEGEGLVSLANAGETT